LTEVKHLGFPDIPRVISPEFHTTSMFVMCVYVCMRVQKVSAKSWHSSISSSAAASRQRVLRHRWRFLVHVTCAMRYMSSGTAMECCRVCRTLGDCGCGRLTSGMSVLRQQRTGVHQNVGMKGFLHPKLPKLDLITNTKYAANLANVSMWL